LPTEPSVSASTPQPITQPVTEPAVEPGAGTERSARPTKYLWVPPRSVPIKVLGAVLALAVAAVIGTIVVMGRQQSPADIARDRQPPIVRPVTVKVTKEVLEVSFRDPQASYRFSNPRPIALATSAAKTGATQIVTRAPKSGQVLVDNQVFMNVTGRPVIALQADPISADGQLCGAADEPCTIPMYRDLRTGDRGPDVAQLQSALKRLGFFGANLTGRYEASTATAVAKWYESLSVDPFTPTGSSEPMVPANGVVFFQKLPARVDEVHTVTGAPVGQEAALTVTEMQLVVASEISVDQVQYVNVGTKVALIDQSGATSEGTVIAVATKPGGPASNGRYAVEISTAEISTAASNSSGSSVSVGTVVTVIYPVKRSPQPLLAVPVTGLYPCAAAQPGTECVHIAIGDGAAFSEMVVKRIMTSSSGLAGVEQATDSLKEGQTVLINRQEPSISDVLPGPEDLGQASSRTTVPTSSLSK
jgi:peptidoglycan hydrolase-like protein with peptidoglycan-binding domain